MPSQSKAYLSPKRVTQFQQKILAHFRQNYRAFPWRDTNNPYEILVSEIMLQQTQTDRVLPFYKKFLAAFPDLSALDQAALADVLAIWQGLGYNRRALALKKLAREIILKHGGKVPRSTQDLVALPGIGPYTAAALRVFAFAEAEPMLETNIRTVVLVEFFAQRKTVSDGEILALLEQTLDRKQARVWYYALMDYGNFLKKTHRHVHQKSLHYVKQAPFRGSNRELRGKLIRLLLDRKPHTVVSIARKLQVSGESLTLPLETLAHEGLLKKVRRAYVLA